MAKQLAIECIGWAIDEMIDVELRYRLADIRPCNWWNIDVGGESEDSESIVNFQPVQQVDAVLAAAETHQRTIGTLAAAIGQRPLTVALSWTAQLIRQKVIHWKPVA